MYIRLLILLAVQMFFMSPGYSDPLMKPQVLGKPPACEASSALLTTCHDTAKPCLLVADNEVRDRLFLYNINASEKRLENQTEVPFSRLLDGHVKKDAELSDIEAMARLSKNEIIIFGSHSRNKSCEIRRNRRIYFQARFSKGELKEGKHSPVQASKDPFDCKMLFSKKARKDSMVKSICDALERTEEHADNASSEKQCSEDPAFNLEGAVAFEDEDGDVRVWLGLRAPLVNKNAVLLRQKKKRDEFSFSAAAFLDLGGYGIRALDKTDKYIWGIGGLDADSSEQHTLWRFPIAELKPGATITPETVAKLETSAEGLVILGDQAIIVYDGAEDKESNGTACRKPSRYSFVKVSE